MSQSNPSLKFYYYVLAIVAIASLLVVVVHEAFADSRHISIIVSKTCQLSKKCITIKALADQLDNSDKRISGDFYFDNKTKLWKRDRPAIAGSILLYGSSVTPPTIFIQPDSLTQKNTKIIFIETKIPIYLGPDSNKKENGKMVTYKNRQINNCSSATIGWEQGGYDLLLDTITHLRSDCTSTLKFNDTTTTIKPLVIKDKCTKTCKYLKWLEDAKQKSKQYLLPHNKTLKDNTSKCTYERGEQKCS